MFEFEERYYSEGAKLIAGVDEAGRGPLAGPVCAAAVIMPRGEIIEGINDSKKLSEKVRERLYNLITASAVAFNVVFVDNQTIDQINILEATRLAMKRAIEGLTYPPDIVLVDAVSKLDINVPYLPIIKGDALSYSIAAASILAKVSRDRLMRALDEQYPQYKFAAHKGYPTRAHYEAISNYGTTPIHRQTFLGGKGGNE